MTRIDLQIRPPTPSASLLGSGFVALDIVEGSAGAFAAAGGSCGNVVAILAWLGWNSAVAGRLNDDTAGHFIKQELASLGVDVRNLTLEEKGVSPIVIQRFVEDKDGVRTHRFSLTCPDCKGWLPRYRPMTRKHAAPVLSENRAPSTYYFDRANPATLQLAKWAHENGSLVVFEPQSISEERHFQMAVDLCHVLKFSNDRLGHVQDLGEAAAPSIVIKTDGKNGLHARWNGSWTHLDAFAPSVFNDAAGSGDWCTAGIIHHLGQNGAKGLKELRKSDLERAISLGQALATVNCGFEGARSVMDILDVNSMNLTLRTFSEESPTSIDDWPADGGIKRALPDGLCFSCSGNLVAEEEKQAC